MDTVETIQPALKVVNTTQQAQTLRTYVERSVQNYLTQLGDTYITNLYDIVMAEVKIPLIECVLRHTRGNQSKAAIVLGISRGTLRKLIAAYDIEE